MELQPDADGGPKTVSPKRIDIRFDFRTDARGKDPDTYSPTGAFYNNVDAGDIELPWGAIAGSRTSRW